MAVDSTLQLSMGKMIAVSLLFLTCGWGIFKLSIAIAERLMKRPITLSFLFKDLKAKLWMTASLGFFLPPSILQPSRLLLKS